MLLLLESPNQSNLQLWMLITPGNTVWSMANQLNSHLGHCLWPPGCSMQPLSAHPFVEIKPGPILLFLLRSRFKHILESHVCEFFAAFLTSRWLHQVVHKFWVLLYSLSSVLSLRTHSSNLDVTTSRHETRHYYIHLPHKFMDTTTCL